MSGPKLLCHHTVVFVRCRGRVEREKEWKAGKCGNCGERGEGMITSLMQERKWLMSLLISAISHFRPSPFTLHCTAYPIEMCMCIFYIRAAPLLRAWVAWPEISLCCHHPDICLITLHLLQYLRQASRFYWVKLCFQCTQITVVEIGYKKGCSKYHNPRVRVGSPVGPGIRFRCQGFPKPFLSKLNETFRWRGGG